LDLSRRTRSEADYTFLDNLVLPSHDWYLGHALILGTLLYAMLHINLLFFRRILPQIQKVFKIVLHRMLKSVMLEVAKIAISPRSYSLEAFSHPF